VTGTAPLTFHLIRRLASGRPVRAELVASGADALIDYRPFGDTVESEGIRRPMLRFNDGGRRMRPGRDTLHLPLQTPVGPAHFARRFAHAAPVLDATDTMLFG
jgi:hypothetical protein